MNVFVTGASGGIGYSVVSHLATQGVRVYATDITEREMPEGVTFYPADVTSEADIIAIRDRLAEDGVTLDAIINIAGIFAIGSYIETDADTLRRIFEINYFGAVLVNKTLHKLLKSNGRIIITTSEVSPLTPLPFNSLYSVSKTALDAYADGLRQELNLLGQRVITVRPGAFDTDLSRGSLDKTEKLAESTDLYRSQSAKFYKIVKFFIGKPKHPDKLAPIYYKALTAKHPRLTYTVNRNPLLILMSILPKRLQCFIIKALLGGR